METAHPKPPPSSFADLEALDDEDKHAVWLQERIDEGRHSAVLGATGATLISAAREHIPARDALHAIVVFAGCGMVDAAQAAPTEEASKGCVRAFRLLCSVAKAQGYELNPEAMVTEDEGPPAGASGRA